MTNHNGMYTIKYYVIFSSVTFEWNELLLHIFCQGREQVKCYSVVCVYPNRCFDSSEKYFYIYTFQAILLKFCMFANSNIFLAAIYTIVVHPLLIGYLKHLK